jgi:hypothetical protein
VFSNHLESKHPEAYAIYANLQQANQSEAKFVMPFSQLVAARKFARLIGPSTISLRQATSPDFADFATYLNPSFHPPSRQTLVKNIREEANRASGLIKQLMSDAPMVSITALLCEIVWQFKVHVSTDVWTQRKYRHSYAAVNVHFFVEQLGRQMTICLGVKEVMDHKAVTIHRVVSEFLNEYGKQIEDIGVINTDNARANIAAFR